MNDNSGIFLYHSDIGVAIAKILPLTLQILVGVVEMETGKRSSVEDDEKPGMEVWLTGQTLKRGGYVNCALALAA